MRELTVHFESGKVYEFVVTATNEFGESSKEDGKIRRVKGMDIAGKIYIKLKCLFVNEITKMLSLKSR